MVTRFSFTTLSSVLFFDHRIALSKAIHHLTAPSACDHLTKTAIAFNSSTSVMESSQKGSMPNSKVSANNLGFRSKHSGVIQVQPPRREDLQPSYAQTLHGDESEAEMHGWYGGMSKSPLLGHALKPQNIIDIPSSQSTTSAPCLGFVVQSLAASSAQILTSLSLKETSALSPNSGASTAPSILVWLRSIRCLSASSRSMSRSRSSKYPVKSA